jgi:hypothetical protein
VAADKGTGQLILAPADGRSLVPVPDLQAHLRGCGLLGEPLAGPGRYQAGEQFLRLVTFMGCSPNLEFSAPATGGSFCHLWLPEPRDQPVLLWGRNTQPPRCRICRGRLNDWQERRTAWQTGPEVALTCPHCGQAQRPPELSWRRTGGFARQWLAVQDVFPGEAVPVPGLLQGLLQFSGLAWTYFYVLDGPDGG